MAESNQPALERARQGILEHRQSLGLVRVVDPNGRPVPGVNIEVEQLEHRFTFGCNAFLWGQAGRDDWEEAYRRRFAAVFNQAVLGFYWASYEPQHGQPRYPYTEAVLEWCRTAGIRAKGHPLVWASLPDPAWLPDDPASIYALAHERVAQLVSLFQGRIDVWDVVNEPTLLSWADTRFGGWAQSVGTRSYVTGFLRTARRANPEAVLLVNDVLTEMPYYSLLNDLWDESPRLLFDAVGIQSHMHVRPWSLERVQGVCDEYARLGVPLHFTEVTVLSGARRADGTYGSTEAEAEARQADYVADLYTTLFGHPAVQSIAWWDLSDRGAWKGAAAGLLRADMSPKPAYERVHQLIRSEWWTKASGRTDADGGFRFRAFHGRHRVRAWVGEGWEAERWVTVHPGQRAMLDLVLGAG